MAQAARAGAAAPEGAPTGQLVPASGAYLGAYVEPTRIQLGRPRSPPSRRSSDQIGAKLDLSTSTTRGRSRSRAPADRTFVDSGKVLLLTWGGTPDTKKIVAGDYDT